MKKSVFKSGLVAAIAVVMMSCTTTANAQTGNTKCGNRLIYLQ